MQGAGRFRLRRSFRGPINDSKCNQSRTAGAFVPERLEGRVLFAADPALGRAQSTDDAVLRQSDEQQLTATKSGGGSVTTQAATTTAAVLPVMPTSDGYYGAVVNANNYVTNYMTYLPPDLGLMTDLTGTSAQTWSGAVATVQDARPQMLIGTYHSARDAQYAATLTRYPRRAVPREGLTAKQILMTSPSNADAYIVDYTQSAARKYLVKHVVQDVVNTGRPLAYLDNVSHNESGFPINWKVTTDVVREMSTKLHEQGKRVIVNAAWVPGVTSSTSVDQFISTGVDGVSLEMGFHQNVRTDVNRIRTAMAQYRRMLDAGMTVVFIPLGNATGGANTIENLEVEQRLQAAFGMMFRKPGDRLFTNQIFWRPVPEWTGWTESFGPALGDATVTTNGLGQIVMTRAFANCTLTANVATKEVTVTAVTTATTTTTAATTTSTTTTDTSAQLAVGSSGPAAPATFGSTPIGADSSTEEPITNLVLA